MFQKRSLIWDVVVLGFLKKDNKVLLGKRLKKQFLDQWEFPGGKMEKGETPQGALIRELKEELGINVKVGKLSLVLTSFYDEKSILLIFYHILSWEGKFKPLCHGELRWLTKEDLYSFPLLELNKKYLSEIVEALSF